MDIIKNVGLQAIIESRVIPLNNNIEDVLTDDLTAEEIEVSQSVIKNTSKQIKEVLEKVVPLNSKFDLLKKQQEPLLLKLKFSKIDNFLLCLIIPPAMAFAAGSSITEVITPYFNGQYAKLIFIIVVTLVWLLFLYIIGSSSLRNYHASIKAKSEFEVLDQEINSIIEEKKKLLKTVNAASDKEVVITMARLGILSELLQKLYIIVTDPKNSSTERLLAVEKFFYLLHKKRVDNQLVKEAQKATQFAEEQAFYAKRQADLAQQQLAQQQEITAKQTRELEKQTELIKEKTRLDESRHQDGQPWRF